MPGSGIKDVVDYKGHEEKQWVLPPDCGEDYMGMNIGQNVLNTWNIAFYCAQILSQ